MPTQPLSYFLNKVREINVMIPSGRPKSAASIRSAGSADARPGSPRPTAKRPPSDDDFEVEELPDEPAAGGDDKTAREEQQNDSDAPGEGTGSNDKSPAYVAPIPRIPSIPRIRRDSDGGNASGGSLPGRRRSIPQFIKDQLVGKRIDEFGDIIDETTGKVLGRVAGDLPSMVGRSILNQSGDVLGDDGELLGYVAEAETEGRGHRPTSPSPTRSLEEYMHAVGAPGGLRVDLEGNIMDAEGNIVGSFHDKRTGFGKPAPKEEPRETASPTGAKETKPEEQKQQSSERTAREDGQPNAQSFRKEKESPSDIFLDVKSTTEGIQLTIRIPTVFPGGGEPRVSIS